VYYKLQTLQLESNNKCLEGNRFDPDSTLAGAAFMDDCADVTGQNWKFVEEDKANSPGYYKLQTQFLEFQNKCLEGNVLAPNNTLAGAAFMDDCANVTGQYWKLIEFDSETITGYFQLVTLLSESRSECLEGNSLGETSTLDGASFMADCTNFTGQIWKVIAQP